jgi:inner membrane protein
MDNNRYYEGFYSFLDEDETIRFKSYPSATGLLSGIAEHWPVQRLQSFTKGFYRVSRQDNGVVITDLRMGVEPDYVFSFKIADIGDPHAVVTAVELLTPARNWRRVARIWQRIWDQTIEP